MNTGNRIQPCAETKQGGFTLIEMLIVIAIVAALAAVILMITTRVKASANMARDMTKLREIAVAISGYTGDSNNRLPVDPKYDPSTYIPDDLKNNNTTFCRFELIDRYIPRGEEFPTGSWYAFQKRGNSPWLSGSIKPYPGWQPQANYPALTGPIAFAFNPNIEHTTRWKGQLSVVPDLSQYVVVAEQNDRAANNLNPANKAETRNNVQTRYRASHPGGKGLYLFADGHIETLTGDRSYAYYAANPDERNIWRWW